MINGELIVDNFAGGRGVINRVDGYAIYYYGNVNMILGNYSTEEKAIKVLNMIEKFYENIEYTKFMGCGKEEIASYIFQMPQNEEV